MGWSYPHKLSTLFDSFPQWGSVLLSIVQWVTIAGSYEYKTTNWVWIQSYWISMDTSLVSWYELKHTQSIDIKPYDKDMNTIIAIDYE